MAGSSFWGPGEAMVFCVDKSMSSLQIAQKIGASITEAMQGNREQILARILWNYGELMWNPRQKPLEIKRVTQYNLVIENIFEDPWESVESQVLLFFFGFAS